GVLRPALKARRGRGWHCRRRQETALSVPAAFHPGGITMLPCGPRSAPSRLAPGGEVCSPGLLPDAPRGRVILSSAPRIPPPSRILRNPSVARRHPVARSRKAPSRTIALTAPAPADFDEVLRLIDAARGRAVAAVNKELIDLRWNIGEY